MSTAPSKSTMIRWSHASTGLWRLSSPPTQACPTKCGSTSSHLAEDIVVEVDAHASIVRFWHNPHAQETLRKQLIHTLDDSDLFPFEEQAPLADKLMELAKANQSLIASRRR